MIAWMLLWPVRWIRGLSRRSHDPRMLPIVVRVERSDSLWRFYAERDEAQEAAAERRRLRELRKTAADKYDVAALAIMVAAAKEWP